MFITKKTVGSVDGHDFDGKKPVDVPDELAHELLAIAPDEFEQADKPKGKPAAKSDTKTADKTADDKTTTEAGGY